MNRSRTDEMLNGNFIRHPDLHPTAYKITDPNDIRLILPVKGILPMGCASGVVGHGMIHPNLINAAVLQYNGLTAQDKQFDAMALAPNFDLLLTQGEANEIAKLIAAWDDCSIDVRSHGDMIVQAPFDPTMENLQQHRDCINFQVRTHASRVHMSDVRDKVTPNTELAWLINAMSSILQNQGTNIRAMLYHTLQCRQSSTLVPTFDVQTVDEIVAKVIKEPWLELLSDKDNKDLLGKEPEGRDLIISRGKKGRNNLMWNYAGALLQTGEWMSVPSIINCN